MKIIEPGRIVGDTARVNCKKCGALLEIEPKDVEKRDDVCVYFYKCPCCQQYISVDENDVTEKFFM